MGTVTHSTARCVPVTPEVVGKSSRSSLFLLKWGSDELDRAPAGSLPECVRSTVLKFMLFKP